MNRRRFFKHTGTIGAGLAWDRVQARAGLTASVPVTSKFVVKFAAGAITSLRRASDRFDTDYIRSGHRLGDVVIAFRHPGGEWKTARTATLEPVPALLADGTAADTVSYQISDGTSPLLTLKLQFIVRPEVILWNIALQNVSTVPVEIGDLALPLPMNTEFEANKPASASVLKHSFVSGNASFLFWMRFNSVGPYI